MRRDDDATRAFVKWLISSTKKINTADDGMPKEEKYTPLEFLQNTAGYITAVKELDTKDDKYLQNIAGKNEYLKIAFKQFKDTVKNKNHVIFEEVSWITIWCVQKTNRKCLRNSSS
ncbi:hypothetical protein [Mycoplasmopsis cynos]|uniref:hypothetical protein n=1 Tax=Mycoplasmopsis cynos TaxID=171284 RepID=UPI002207319D|nr:hypothetical protein [Mycoplasmopsis cynos]UWV81759.1 hypothetical protein NW065_01200 [Mycoplasmopsis cynos]